MALVNRITKVSLYEDFGTLPNPPLLRTSTTVYYSLSMCVPVDPYMCRRRFQPDDLLGTDIGVTSSLDTQRNKVNQARIHGGMTSSNKSFELTEYL